MIGCRKLLGHLVVERKFGCRIESRVVIVGAAGVDLVDQLLDFECDLVPTLLEPIEDLVDPL